MRLRGKERIGIGDSRRAHGDAHVGAAGMAAVGRWMKGTTAAAAVGQPSVGVGGIHAVGTVSVVSDGGRQTANGS